MRIPATAVRAALLIYMAAIFILSSIPGDDIPKIGFELSDKLLHALVYLILFILFFYSLKYQAKYIKLRDHALIFAGIFSAIYGATDEVHQYFVPMRSCELSDWLADVAGILAGMLLAGFISRKKVISVSLLTLPLFVYSCNSSGESGNLSAGKLKAKIVSEECWTDHMPVLDERGPRLGFLIKIKASCGTDSVFVDKLYVSVSGSEFVSKPFEIISPENAVKDSIISIGQDRNTNYFPGKPGDDETIRFKLSIKCSGGKSKELITSEIKPYKVY